MGVWSSYTSGVVRHISSGCNIALAILGFGLYRGLLSQAFISTELQSTTDANGSVGTVAYNPSSPMGLFRLLVSPYQHSLRKDPLRATGSNVWLVFGWCLPWLNCESLGCTVTAGADGREVD